MASSPEALPGVSGEAELGQFAGPKVRGYRNPVLTPHVVFVLGAGV